jgi:hypothetical protein
MVDASPPPPSPYQLLERIRRGRGELAILARERPATFLVRARGAIGPALIRADLARARAFGSAHPDGWDYVVDTSEVRFAHPLNVFWLREIRKLPNLSRYMVVAPSPSVRRAIAWTRWLVRPDRVVESMDELERR